VTWKESGTHGRHDEVRPVRAGSVTVNPSVVDARARETEESEAAVTLGNWCEKVKKCSEEDTLTPLRNDGRNGGTISASRKRKPTKRLGVQLPGSVINREVHMDTLDRDLRRACELSLENVSDEAEAGLNKVLPALVSAGYVEEYGHSTTGSFWRFTEAGVKRAEELGCL
jgi:hypothetical protein